MSEIEAVVKAFNSASSFVLLCFFFYFYARWSMEEMRTSREYLQALLKELADARTEFIKETLRKP